MGRFKDILKREFRPDSYTLTPLYLEAIQDLRNKIKYEESLFEEIEAGSIDIKSKDEARELLRKCEIIINLQESYSGFIHFLNDNARFFELQVKRESLFKELFGAIKKYEEAEDLPAHNNE